MAEIEVVKFRDLIPVTAVPRFAPGVSAPTLEVEGEDFSSVEEVLINDVKASEFMVLSKNRLWVQVPSNITQISSIEVMSSNFTRTSQFSKLQFKLGNNLKEISGLLKLVQLFAKWVLQTSGSSILHPSRGGGLQELAGKIQTTRKMDSVLATLTMAVDTTASQIRTAQNSNMSLPLDEKLLSASLVGMDVQPTNMVASARVRIKSMAGQEAVNALFL